jgi:hypothetical protein|tara:strand:- start:2214 stop:2639 length:426 start_codon:yes stop_codon:yes gene_type:complete
MSVTFKDCQKAVNQAKYTPTAERKALALKLLTELTEAISNLEEVEARPSKSNPLARKASAGRPKSRNQRLERQQAKASVSTTYLEPEAEKSYQARREAVYTLSEGETVEEAMAKLRTKRMLEADALAVAEFEKSLSEDAPF